MYFSARGERRFASHQADEKGCHQAGELLKVLGQKKFPPLLFVHTLKNLFGFENPHQG
jgi:hypothetical protein